MDFDTLMRHLMPLTKNDLLEITELLCFLKDDGLISSPRLPKSGNIALSDKQAQEILSCLTDKGFESCLDESLRTGKSVDDIADSYGRAERFIRHNMTCISLEGHTLHSLSAAIGLDIMTEAGYTQKY